MLSGSHPKEEDARGHHQHRQRKIGEKISFSSDNLCIVHMVTCQQHLTSLNMLWMTWTAEKLTICCCVFGLTIVICTHRPLERRATIIFIFHTEIYIFYIQHIRALCCLCMGVQYFPGSRVSHVDSNELDGSALLAWVETLKLKGMFVELSVQWCELWRKFKVSLTESRVCAYVYTCCRLSWNTVWPQSRG